jgi:hypothetical protein
MFQPVNTLARTIARTRAEFVDEVRRALTDGGPRRERSELVRSEAWDARVDEIGGHIAALLDDRRAA